MGRATPQQAARSAARTGEEEPEPLSITHFSHVHPLRRTVLPPPAAIQAFCDGCRLPCCGVAYSCDPCDYLLHKTCATAPRTLLHQSHAHALVFAAKPPYPDGTFSCDACGKHGSGFCFRCTVCDFDLHVLCATAPQQVKLHSHQHQLLLHFSIPYPIKVFQCDVCGLHGSPSRWLYHCAACSFDAHLHCASTATAPPARIDDILNQLRNQNSPSSTMPQQQLPVDPYAEILANQRQELENFVALIRAQTNNQIAAELQAYRLGAAQAQRVQNPVGGGNGSMDALLQQLSGMGLNNGGGGGGGDGNLSGLLGQLGSMVGQGGLSSLLGGGGGGGLDLGSIASLFFS